MTTEVRHDAARGERPSRRRAGIEEFWSLPESVLPTEYVNGEIVMAPAPTVTHQRVLGNIYFTLRQFVSARGLGECFFSPLDVLLPTGDVVQPDIIFLAAAEARRAGDDKRISAVPPLVVEILSPGSVGHDTLTKRALYERSGVGEYWIVDPDARTLAQLTLRAGGYLVTELTERDTVRAAALPGFESTVADLLGA